MNSLPSYLHVFAAVACDRMMSPDGERSAFIVISGNSNVAMPVEHRARLLPPPPPPPVLTHALRHCLSCAAGEAATVARRRRQSNGVRERCVRERASRRVLAGERWTTDVRISSITEGTFPKGLLRLSASSHLSHGSRQNSRGVGIFCLKWVIFQCFIFFQTARTGEEKIFNSQ